MLFGHIFLYGGVNQAPKTHNDAVSLQDLCLFARMEDSWRRVLNAVSLGLSPNYGPF